MSTITKIYKHVPKAIQEALNSWRFDDYCQDARWSGGYCQTTASHVLKQILLDEGLELTIDQINEYEQVMRFAFDCSERGMS